MATLTVAPNPAAPSTSVVVTGTGFQKASTRLLLDGATTGSTFRPDGNGRFQASITVASIATTQTLVAQQQKGVKTSPWYEVCRTTFVVQGSASLTTSNITVGNITQTSVVVSWATNVSAGGQVEYGTTTAYGSFTVYLSPAPTQAQAVSGLAANTLYHYRIRADDEQGQAASSADGSFTTLASAPTATAPGAPTGLTATSGATTVNLAWSAPSSNGGSAITGYKVYRGGVLVQTLGVVLTWQNTGLVNGTSYSYQVSAVNAVGEGAKSTAATTTGIPAIPAGRGTVLRKDFADGHMGFPGSPGSPLFVGQTHNNDHPGQLMVQYETFVTDSAHISVHDGYLDLRCTRNGAGEPWSASLVGTYIVNANPPTRTFDFQYGTVRWMARMNYGVGAWHGLWYWALWSAPDTGGTEPEIDWPELIQSRITANIHSTSFDGQPANRPPPGPTEWHEYGIVKTSTYIAFLLDGTEVARWTHAMPGRQCLLADAKVGLEAPNSTTPSSLFLQVAWVTVD